MTATGPSWQPPSRSAVLTPSSSAVRHHGHGYKAALPQRAHAPLPSRCSAGGPVTPFEHNWVLYFQTGDYQCGAFLINEQWALTAAHCLNDAQGKGIAVSKMKVFVHRHDISDSASEHKCAQTVKIAKKFEHPSWNDRTTKNDIALLRLSQVHTTPSHTLANRRRLPLPKTFFQPYSALALPLDNLHLRSPPTPPDPPSPRSR